MVDSQKQFVQTKWVNIWLVLVSQTQGNLLLGIVERLATATICVNREDQLERQGFEKPTKCTMSSVTSM